MLSEQEFEYVKNLVSTYQKLGYKYYVCYTTTDDNIDIDVNVCFSKKEIHAISDNIFSIEDGIKITLKSSNYRYNDRPNVVNLITTISGDLIAVNDYEYIYTNAITDYDTTEYVVNPDLLYSNLNYENTQYFYISVFLLSVIFLYMFVKSILRLRR